MIGFTRRVGYFIALANSAPDPSFGRLLDVILKHIGQRLLCVTSGSAQRIVRQGPMGWASRARQRRMTGVGCNGDIRDRFQRPAESLEATPDNGIDPQSVTAEQFEAV